MSTDNLFEDIEQDNNPSFYGNPSILNDPYRPIQPPPPPPQQQQQQQQQHQENESKQSHTKSPKPPLQSIHSGTSNAHPQLQPQHNININIILCSIMVILMNWSTVLLDYPIEFLNY